MTATQDPTDVRHDDPHFARRHIGITDQARSAMLERLGFDNLDALIEAVVPAGVRSDALDALPAAATETTVAAELRQLAAKRYPPLGPLHTQRCWGRRMQTPGMQ